MQVCLIFNFQFDWNFILVPKCNNFQLSLIYMINLWTETDCFYCGYIMKVAAWTCVLVFILQIVLCVLRVVRNRRRRSAQMFDSAQKTQTSSDTSKITELEPTAWSDGEDVGVVCERDGWAVRQTEEIFRFKLFKICLIQHNDQWYANPFLCLNWKN